MKLSSILLSIISRMDGERTIYAGLHLLRGKRSGQTLSDVEYYNLKAFFGILPKLKIELYDEAAGVLINSGYLSITEHSLVVLTEKGRSFATTLPTYYFNGWDYRGNEMIFYARLSLFVQTISNFRLGEKSFMPIEKDYEIQTFVKSLVHGQPIHEPSFSLQFMKELSRCIEKSKMTDIQKTILTHRLVGGGLTGWTWNQLADSLKLSMDSIRLLFVESIHRLLVAIETSTDAPFLRKMTKDIKVSSYLTLSAMQTKNMFDNGLSMNDIATLRKLKMSTIEDHFVELSINDAAFPLDKFVSGNDIQNVLKKADELATKRLRLLKDEFEHLTYFQLRLILGAQSKGEATWISIKS
ncbi:helix-turn-helix domain-containing protein [Sporosarcina sp. G11-34]|uniref:helix-turn-helix domain-containing protein n=1 Tax=Sporosarcina sp. G11-34 TaxID=2849605 RepID=UPI0022A96F45|nr:helix-turn-helix domain-containing protein [Sporosarcina sp. G11-34]MCZ2259486.1 helix-turn-helix domain-containing protein [Sporosarcina sp. G11-34]